MLVSMKALGFTGVFLKIKVEYELISVIMPLISLIQYSAVCQFISAIANYIILLLGRVDIYCGRLHTQPAPLTRSSEFQPCNWRVVNTAFHVGASQSDGCGCAGWVPICCGRHQSSSWSAAVCWEILFWRGIKSLASKCITLSVSWNEMRKVDSPYSEW